MLNAHMIEVNCRKTIFIVSKMKMDFVMLCVCESLWVCAMIRGDGAGLE